ncbi:MAG: hypothetical protein ACJ76J_05365 [Thermoanaerobaculia bacterium]
MPYRRLFLFLEGDDDERFFQSVVFPALRKRYEDILAVQVSQLKKKKIADWLRSIEGMGADCLYVRDLDRHPCVTAAKQALRDAHPRLSPDCIQIVKAEIESWYCAGIGPGTLADLEIATCLETEGITKEKLEAVIPGGRVNRIPTLVEILEGYDLRAAARRNASLRYFLTKHLGIGE